jgi:hypothetical protein
MFTRRHYLAIAEIVRAEPDPEVRERLAYALIRVFASDNPRFDAGRFREACKPAE